MTINCWSVFAAIKYASAAMEQPSSQKPKSGGSIVATASIAGTRSGSGSMSYAASKAAVINLCQTGAWRLHGKNIRGVIETEMTGALLTTIYQNPEKHKLMMRHNALERYGRPEEATSDEASFITEQAIKVDGGATVAFSYLPLFAEG
ncbi:hypothetical protein EDC94DRAFT_697133 [Helicostylum pulchrum]|nr:hypothetical protein EDC94DRAFT_697133 [Helicostylum pulchrum]